MLEKEEGRQRLNRALSGLLSVVVVEVSEGERSRGECQFGNGDSLDSQSV